jgi:hypothetical protein
MTIEMTPNVKKLFILRMSRQAVPDGGGLSDGIDFFLDGEKRRVIMANSKEWVRKAIDAVRDGGEPNPWCNADDETIAAEILRRVEKEKQ